MNVRSLFLAAVYWMSGVTLGLSQSFVDRVDPPHWWVGMPVDTVQIMIHGRGIGALEPRIDYPGVELCRIARTGSIPTINSYTCMWQQMLPQASSPFNGTILQPVVQSRWEGRHSN